MTRWTARLDDYAQCRVISGRMMARWLHGEAARLRSNVAS